MFRCLLFAALASITTAQAPSSTAASVTPYGSGCTGTVTSTPPALATSAAPVLGTTINFDTSGLPAGGLFTVLALHLISDPTGSTINATGMPGCLAFIATTPPPLTLFAFVAGPSTSVPISVPNNPLFLGFEFYAQSVAHAPGDNPWNLLVTNALDVIVGT